MAELLKALSADERHPKAPSECADIAIVLARYAERRNFWLFQHWNYRFPGCDSTYQLALELNQQMAHLMLHHDSDRLQAIERCGRIIAGLLHQRAVAAPICAQ